MIRAALLCVVVCFFISMINYRRPGGGKIYQTESAEEF
jgi:hypothetical protein